MRSFGLCHLIEDKNGVYPATVEAEATAVSPDSQERIVIYHRALNGQIAPREDLSFGRGLTGQTNQSVRTVVFIDINEDQNKIDDIINALPDSFEVEGYQFCNIAPEISLIRDRDAIWEEEFSGSYKSRFQKRFQVYALEWTLEYIKCHACELS